MKLLTEDLPERLSELDSGAPMHRKAGDGVRQLRCNEGLESIKVDWGTGWNSEAAPERPCGAAPGARPAPAKGSPA